MVVDLAFLEPLKELMADEQVKEVGRGLLEEVGRLSYSNSFIAINLWNYVLGAGLLVILGAVVLPLFGIDLLGTSYTAVAKAGYGNILPGSNDEVILQLQEKVATLEQAVGINSAYGVAADPGTAAGYSGYAGTSDAVSYTS